MPPSGFSNDQASKIIEFLRSCAQALEIEANTKSETHLDALQREVASIDRCVSHSAITVEYSILTLVRQFYAEVMIRIPRDQDAYHKAVGECLDLVRQQIIGIHVVP